MSTHINVGVNETRVCGAGRVCSIFIMLYPSFHADPTRPTPKRQGKGIFFNTKGTKESISNRENETAKGESTESWPDRIILLTAEDAE